MLALSPQLPRAPVALRALWMALRLSDASCRTLWKAMNKSQWASTIAYKQELVVYRATVGTESYARYLAEHLLAPSRILDLLEALVHEGALPRAAVVDMEEAVLAHMTKDGTWLPALARPEPLLDVEVRHGRRLFD